VQGCYFRLNCRMTRVLVVGSTSAVGWAVAKRLNEARDCQVLLAGRRSAEINLELTALAPKSPVDLHFDVLVHSVADFGGSDDAEVRRAEIVNAVGTLDICSIARRAGAKHLVIISSASAVYGPLDLYYGIYSLSKRHGEELADLYCRSHNLPLTILRPAQLYDAEGRCRRHQRLFYTIVDNAKQNRDIEIFGRNDAVRDYLYLEDLAEIVASVVLRQVIGTFHCSGPEPARLSEIAATAIQVFNSASKIRFLPGRPDIPDLPTGSGDSLYSMIKYAPTVKLLEGITRIKAADSSQ